MAFSPETYALCLKNTTEKIDEALTSVYNYKGSVDTIADLPLTNNKVGDTYDVKSEGGQNYGWNGESWDSLGVNREATDTDLGLIKKKDNTFNTTTFVGDMTAINSNNTSITGSGITSVNGEGNFEVSKPTTIIASKTTNITGNGMTSVNGEGSFEVTKPITVIASDTTNIGGFKLNINGGHVNISSTDVNILGDRNITITSNREPIKITSSLNVEGSATFNRTVQAKNFTDEKVALDAYNDGDIGNIFLGGVEKATSGTTTRTYNLVLNNYTGTYPTTLSNNATGNLCIGNSNTLNGNYNTVLGISNFTIGNYSFVKGQDNVANALGSTIFGSNSRTNIGAEYGLVSGVRSSVNGKTATVLGDNLIGSTETGSLTVGAYNSDTKAVNSLFTIGNGYQNEAGDSVRQNAFTVDKNGVIETPFVRIKENKLIMKNPSSEKIGLCLSNSPLNEEELDIYKERGYLCFGASTSNSYISDSQVEIHGNKIALDSRGYMKINPDLKWTGPDDSHSICQINTDYNGMQIGKIISSSKIASSKGTIIYLGDNLNYVSGSDNDTQYNHNGILITGNYNNTNTPTKNNLFIVGNGYQAGDTTNGSNALRLTNEGTLYYKTGMGAGADYAEFFEWSDGNPNNEDRCGLFVTFDFDKEYEYNNSQELPHIKPAEEGDYILGVISGNPSFVGNADEEWKKRWLYDEFDRPIMKAVQVPITELKEVETGEYRTEIEYDENDNEVEVQTPIVKTKEVETGKYRTEFIQVPNPEYDASKTYISRSNRKEWETTGMLGALSVKDDGTCQVGKFCKCGKNGIATFAEKRDIDTFLVLRRVNDNIIKIIFK